MNTNFGGNLRRYRKMAALNQSQLARQLGVTQTTIANYEGDLRFPDQYRLFALSRILRIPVDALIASPPPTGPVTVPESSAVVQLILSGRQEEAWNQINTAVLKGAARTEIQETLFIPLLHRTGDLWKSGGLNIAEEHLISSSITEFLARLRLPLPNVPPDAPTALCITFPGERHIMGLQMLRNRLDTAGWRTLLPGSGIPEHDLYLFLQRARGDLLIISASIIESPEQVIHLIRKIRSIPGYTRMPLLLGGEGFRRHLESTPFDKYTSFAATLGEGMIMAGELIKPGGTSK